MSEKKVIKKPRNIVICFTGGAGFPRGMAGSKRVKLLSKALVEQGHKVLVLIPSASELPSSIQNTNLSGNLDGILYEYTSFTTVINPNKWRRKINAYVGKLRILLRLITLKLEGRLDLLYMYPNISHYLEPMRFIIPLLTKILGVPVVLELVEWLWTMKSKKTFLERHLSPLFCINGVSAISKYLEDWTLQEAEKMGCTIPTIRIPILVDVNEFREGKPAATPKVLFSGSPGYVSTIRFVLDTMEYVWKFEKECKLIITGCRTDDPNARWLIEELKDNKYEGRVDLAGFVTNEQLLKLYSEAYVHLIPLFDDYQSRARFPTKISEYLSSFRPVVTNDVGEINRYLCDEESAYICPPGDIRAYGDKIIKAIEDFRKGNKVGYNGRLVAEKSFHYALYGNQLTEFFDKIINS